MRDWTRLAGRETVEATVRNLKARNIDAIVVKNGGEAKERVMAMIPQGTEVMTAQSKTLEDTGIASEINDSGRYDSVRKRIMAITDEKERREFRRKSAAVDYVVGSVQAVTEAGQVVMASAGGSQLPYYAATANKVIWVVGTHKIVKNLDEAFERINERALPLESERLKKAYGRESSVNKILIVEKEWALGRATLVFVEEPLGF